MGRLKSAGVVLAMVFASSAFGQDVKPNDSVKKSTNRLAQKLIRGKTEDKDVMSRIMTRMSDVEEKLGRGHDPGAETQEMQRTILKELEKAIAASISRGRNNPSEQPEGDVRRRPKEEPKPASRSKGSDSKPDDSAVTRDAVQNDSREKENQPRESQRAWGNLPPREREEVIQGASEASLEKYREWIERYYKALAEKP